MMKTKKILMLIAFLVLTDSDILPVFAAAPDKESKTQNANQSQNAAELQTVPENANDSEKLRKSTFSPLKRLLFGVSSSLSKDFSEESDCNLQTIFREKAEGSFYSVAFAEKETESSFGFSLNLFDLKIPLSFRFGHLSVSGLISKLKKPELSSTVSFLASKTTGTGTLSASLPTTVSQTRKLSAFSSIHFDSFFSKQLLLDFSAFYDESESLGFSIKSSFDFNPYSRPLSKKSLRFDFSAAALYSSINHSDSEWYSSVPYFSQRKNIFLNLQTGFFCKFFSSKLTLNLFQNPIHQREFDFTYSIESSFFTGNFLLNLAFFSCSSNQIWNASNSIQKTLSQIKINPQFTLFFLQNKIRLKTGISFLAEEKLDSDSDYTNSSESDSSDSSSASEEETDFQTKQTAINLFQTFSNTIVKGKFQGGMEISSKNWTSKVSFQASELILGKSFEKITGDDGLFSDEKKIFQNAKYQAEIKTGGRNSRTPKFTTTYTFSESTQSTFSHQLKQSLQFYPFKSQNLSAGASCLLTFSEQELSSTKIQASLSGSKTFELFSIQGKFAISFTI